MACTWFGEICSFALNNSRNKFHQTTYKAYFRALYSIVLQLYRISINTPCVFLIILGDSTH